MHKLLQTSAALYIPCKAPQSLVDFSSAISTVISNCMINMMLTCCLLWQSRGIGRTPRRLAKSWRMRLQSTCTVQESSSGSGEVLDSALRKRELLLLDCYIAVTCVLSFCLQARC